MNINVLDKYANIVICEIIEKWNRSQNIDLSMFFFSLTSCLENIFEHLA